MFLEGTKFECPEDELKTRRGGGMKDLELAVSKLPQATKACRL